MTSAGQLIKRIARLGRLRAFEAQAGSVSSARRLAEWCAPLPLTDGAVFIMRRPDWIIGVAPSTSVERIAGRPSKNAPERLVSSARKAPTDKEGRKGTARAHRGAKAALHKGDDPSAGDRCARDGDAVCLIV